MSNSDKKQKITITIDLPRTCGLCPFFNINKDLIPYCRMGFMSDVDARKQNYNDIRFFSCKFVPGEIYTYEGSIPAEEGGAIPVADYLGDEVEII